MLAFIKTPPWTKMTDEAKQAFGELVESLGDAVEEVDLTPSASDAWAWHKTIMEADMAAAFEREWQQGKDKLSEPLRSLIERGREVRAIDYQRARQGVPQIVESFDEMFMERYDAILTPSAPGSAPKGLGSTGDPAFCTLWTLCGMPAVTLPLMQDSGGLPIGVQLVGRRNFDARLLRTARWLADRVQAQA
jgi:Asp-tRNA(Asn)/Glu-tRNA(Gln) amidotransferase A subunit family amidase